MNTRTVLIDTQLDGHASLAALYDPAVYQVAYFDGAANGHVQIQDYLTAHQIDLSTINVVTASDSTSGLFNARVVFVDPGVADHQSLIAQLPADATVVVLDAHSDGVQQIRDFLAHNEGLVTAVDIITDVATVDLISHGGAGEVTLGSTVLSAGNLAAYQDVLADIGSHLADGADILIYGCDVASGTQGQAFIEALSVATGADVAASTDLTGSAALGGDWVLEASAGTVEAQAISAPDYAEVFQVRINLNGATGVGSTNFTEQTAVDLFPSAIFNPNGNDADKVDTVTVSMANPAATRTLSLNASAAATASTNSVTVGYNVATGVLTLTGSNETNTAWELILRGVQYHDSSESPTSPGTITVTGTESGGPTVGTDTHSVVVVPVNDAPTTTPVTLTAIAEDSGPHLITQAQLLANASDPDGNPLTATNLAIATGGGALVNNGNGTWSYTPATNDSTSVQFSYLVSDGSLSAAGSATLDITPAEDEATGTLAVTGSAQEGGSLVALLTATDADGAITTAYRWQEKIAGVWTDIAGANTGTLAIPGDQSYVGKEVRAVATSTDPVGGTTVFEGTGQVIANVEDEATGTLAVTGTAQEGGSLVAALTATDADGSITTAYRWQEKIAGVWTDIAGANTGALAIPGNQSYVGKEVRAVATSTDPFGGTTVFEGTGQTIANVNDAPVGTVTISGTATEDQTLTASNDLADEDGLGPISYSWEADGVAFATGG
uniref:DUF4347 domain-containing protein n=1 Tax=Hydrogenophaga sp. OTU3427 TaxID=3043856 RepID=UPI00313D3449